MNTKSKRNQEIIPEDERKQIRVSILGGKPELREYHIKCNTIITSGLDLVGRYYDYCGCGSKTYGGVEVLS